MANTQPKTSSPKQKALGPKPNCTFCGKAWHNWSVCLICKRKHCIAAACGTTSAPVQGLPPSGSPVVVRSLTVLEHVIRDKQHITTWSNFTKFDPPEASTQVWIVMMQRIKNFQVIVPNDTMQKYAASLGSNAQVAMCNPSTHPRAAIARGIASNYVLKFLEPHINGGNVLSIHGHARFCNSVKNLSFNLVSSLYEANKDKIEDFPPLNVYLLPSQRTSKDAVNASFQVGNFKHANACLKPFSIGYAIDLYFKDEFGIFTLFNSIPNCNKFVVLTQVFHDSWECGLNFDECFWFKENGLICQAPGLGESAWAPCSTNLFWLKQDSYIEDGYVYRWTTHKVFGDYYVFQVVRSFNDGGETIFTPDPLVSNPGLIRKTTIPYQYWTFARLKTWLTPRSIDNNAQSQELLIFEPAIQALSASLTGKNRQAYQLNSLTNEVKNILNQPKYDVVWKKFDIQQILTDTVSYIAYHNIDHEHSVMDSMMNGFSSIVQDIRQMKSDTIVGTISKYSYYLPAVFLGIGALIAGYFSFKAYTKVMSVFQLPLNPVVQDSILSPPSELPLAWFNNSTIIDNVTDDMSLLKSGLRYQDYAVAKPILTECMQNPDVSIEVKNIAVARIMLPIMLGLMAPFYEEVMKRAPSWLMPESLKLPMKIVSGALFGMMEGLTTYPTEPLVPRMLVHTLFTVLPFKYGNGLHAANNLAGCFDLVRAYPLCCMSTWMAFGVNALFNPFGFLSMVPLGYAMNMTWAAIIGHKRPNYTFLNDTYLVILLLSSLAAAWLLLLPKKKESKIADFRADYREFRHFDKDYLPFEKFSYEEAILPTTVRNLTSIDDFGIEDTKPNEQGLFILLGNTQMFMRPQGLHMFMHAFRERCIKALPEGFTDCPINCLELEEICIKCHTWNDLRSTAYEFFNLIPTDNDLQNFNIEEWADHYSTSAKKKRAHLAIKNWDELNRKDTSEVFLKGDEVLYAKKDALGERSIKPRVVKSFDPTVQVALAEPVTRAMFHLKECCKVSSQGNFILNGFRVWVQVGCGMNSSDLSHWFNKALEFCSVKNSCAFIVVGDDLFGVISDKDGNVNFFESDFTRFDRTQGASALQFSEYCLYVASNYDLLAAQLDLKVQLSTPDYKNHKYNLKVPMKHPIQRGTGAASTTFGNCVNDIFSFLFYILNIDKFDSLDEAQAFLGFIGKVKTSSKPNKLTFLKGWFIPCDTGYQWLPLPSQILKLGKVLTDPRKVFKVAADLAWRQMAKGVGLCYFNIPSNYPILGPFIEKLLSVYQGKVAEYHDRFDLHKIRVVKCSNILVTEVYEMIEKRYGLTRCQILELEAEIKTANFPGMLVSPHIRNLVVDYS